MKFKCWNCSQILDSEVTSCPSCGRKIFTEFTLENCWEAYVCISSRGEMSQLARRYRKGHYAVSKEHPLNALLGGCFTVGYHVRQTEQCFNNVFRKDLRAILHNSKTRSILDSDVPEEEKIASIAEYKETNNDRIGLGSEVADYSIFGLAQSQSVMEGVIQDYMEGIKDSLGRLNLPARDLLEIVYRNVCLGYCYGVAEEIVLSGLPMSSGSIPDDPDFNRLFAEYVKEIAGRLQSQLFKVPPGLYQESMVAVISAEKIARYAMVLGMSFQGGYTFLFEDTLGPLDQSTAHGMLDLAVIAALQEAFLYQRNKGFATVAEQCLVFLKPLLESAPSDLEAWWQGNFERLINAKLMPGHCLYMRWCELLRKQSDFKQMTAFGKYVREISTRPFQSDRQAL